MDFERSPQKYQIAPSVCACYDVRSTLVTDAVTDLVIPGSHSPYVCKLNSYAGLI